VSDNRCSKVCQIRKTLTRSNNVVCPYVSGFFEKPRSQGMQGSGVSVIKLFFVSNTRTEKPGYIVMAWLYGNGLGPVS
jgi:hypothetical protein